MSLTDLLFGSTLKHAKREALTYDPELGGRQKDLGDYLGDFFTGQGAALDKATEEQYIKGLKGTYQNDIDALNKYGLSDKIIDKKTTRTELDNLISKYAEEVKLNKTVDKKAALAGYIPQANLSYQEKLKGLNEFIDNKEQEKGNRFGGAIEKERHARQIAAQARYDTNQQLMLQQQNLMADREDARLDRQMERELAERRLEMQEARDFRKDRQMAIMQIVKGLQGMGQAFSF
jgi:hypothetical protein